MFMSGGVFGGGDGRFPGYGPGGGHGRNFVEVYRCNSMAMHDKQDKEGGDKIILPTSAFERLASMIVTYPLQFELCNARISLDLTGDEGSNDNGQVRTHVGVLEFTAPEGKCYIPHWIMQNLLVEEGGFLQVKNVSLPLATFLKFRPRSEDFLDISNPKAVLESTLRNFSCMTTNDQICIPYNGRKYYLDVVEVKPSFACSIVEADVNVEFAPPPGYEEKLAKMISEKKNTEEGSNGNSVNAVNKDSSHPKDATQAVEDLMKAESARRKMIEANNDGFSVFSGVGRRLDNKTKKEEKNLSLEGLKDQTACNVTTLRKSKRKVKNRGCAFAGEGSTLG